MRVRFLSWLKQLKRPSLKWPKLHVKLPAVFDRVFHRKSQPSARTPLGGGVQEDTGSRRLVTSTVIRSSQPGGSAYRWLKWVPLALPVIIGFAIADLTTDVLYFLLHDLPDRIKVNVPYQPPPSVVALKRSLVTDLVATNLLDHTNTLPGQMAQPGGELALSPDKATKSSLPHKLVGTIVFSEPRRGIATVSKGKDVKSYLQGEQVQPGYVVWGVQRGRLYLHNINKNTLEYLALTLGGEQAGPANLSSGASRGRTLKEMPKEIHQISGDKYTVERSFIQQKLKNLQDLLTQAQAAPTGDGWKIVNIAEGSIFEYVGIQPGDIIVGVNGKEVKTQADAVMLFNQFQSGAQNTIQLQLRRDGQDMVMTYELK